MIIFVPLKHIKSVFTFVSVNDNERDIIEYQLKLVYAMTYTIKVCSVFVKKKWYG